MVKCSLCGGNLDSKKRCTFCGLDNTKNDDMYKHLVNQNDCSNQPLTHIHTDEENASQKAQSENAKDKVKIICAIIALIATIISFLTGLGE